jgi:hypothetical protein
MKNKHGKKKGKNMAPTERRIKHGERKKSK